MVHLPVRARNVLLLATVVAATILVVAGTAKADGHSPIEQSAVPRADEAALVPAERLDVPAAPDAPVPLFTNQSTCRSDLPGATLTISIPSIQYSCPVYVGGQSTIDSGAVTLDIDPGPSAELALTPGGSGTLWIAAHRASHGGAFAAVPSVVDGSLVTVSDGTTTATYRIVGRFYATVIDGLVLDSSAQPAHAATVDSILRTDHGANQAPRLLLQTCDGTNHRWMIYGDLVSVVHTDR